MESDNPHGVDAPQENGLALAVSLTAISGFVDAAAFVQFGGLFVSFMSGDSTKLAALPSLGRGGEAALAAGAVALFVAGAFAGRLVQEAAGAWRRPALLCVTAGLLGLAALAGAAAPAIGAPGLGLSIAGMTLAMGVMNAVLSRVGEAKLAGTYVTGVLFHLGRALAEVAMGRGAPWATYLLSWLGLVLGAAVGAQASLRLGLAVLAAPAAFAALLAILSGDLVRAEAAGRGR